MSGINAAFFSRPAAGVPNIVMELGIESTDTGAPRKPTGRDDGQMDETLSTRVPLLDAGSARDEWRAGWTVVFASMLGFVVAGIHLYSMGLFIEPLEREFGWPRAEIASAMMIPSIFAFFLSPLFGHLVDRWGSRRIGLMGAIGYCLSFALLSLTHASIWSWWALWVLIALSLVLVKPTVWSAAISSRFSAGRGLALAVALCGTGLCSTVTPIAANALAFTFGWRGAFIGLGLGWGLVIVPILFLFFFDARDIGRRSATPVTVPTPVLTGYSVREGLRSPYFYRLAIIALLATSMIVGFVVHFIPMLTSAGVARTTAASIAGSLGITSVIGRLSVGSLFDRFSGPRVAAISLALPAVTAILLLAFSASLPITMLAAAILGWRSALNWIR
jgi:predicted MFS family arabinose efflux permease